MITSALLLLASVAPSEVQPNWIWLNGLEYPAPTALRINDIRLRDPHMFAQLFPGSFGCIDITDTGAASINGQLNAPLNQDTNPADGFIDASTLLLFRPLERTNGVRLLEQASGQCTFPVAGTQCQAGTDPVAPTNYGLFSAGDICLGPLPGTTGGYNPAVPSIQSTCFTTAASGSGVGGGGIQLSLIGSRIAGTLAALPSNNVSSGLIRGFMPESVANLVVLPSTLPPPLGGATLSSLLPGGTGNCSTRNDVDVVNGMRGWWFYLAYTANEVPYTQPPTQAQRRDQ